MRKKRRQSFRDRKREGKSERGKREREKERRRERMSDREERERAEKVIYGEVFRFYTCEKC